MAVDTLGAAPSHRRAQSLAFADAAFVAFLLLIFVTLKPFAVRDMATLPLGDPGTGVGDTLRQICFLGVFSALGLAAFQARGIRAFFAVPPLLAILLGWCLLSSLWAQSPDVAMRRASLEVVIALSTVLGVQAIGPERALQLSRNVLAAVLVINFVSIALVHQAVHLSDESDRALIGNWRGLYFHKNIAGAVTALTAALFFFHALDTKRRLHWLIFAAAAFFLLMTRSKSSIALLPIALAAGLIFRSVARHTIERWILFTALLLLLGIAAMAAAVEFGALARYFTDPSELTGRVAIWQAEFAFIRDHPLLGAGFGSFADTGALSPLYNYVADKWVQGEAHGHNAYLQLVVTIGGVGFALAMLAFVAQPFFCFRRIDGGPARRFFAPLFAIFVFEIFHNAVESDFLEGDGPAWVAFLLMLACLHFRPAPEERRAGETALAWQAP